MQYLNLEQAERAVVACFVADLPVAIWGGIGIGKSSLVKQIARKLGYTLYDFRLSDKEPSDLGGIPFPQDGRLHYLMPSRLPFLAEGENTSPEDEKSIVFLDEFDRSRLDVQNSALQLILDQELNGHKLSGNAFVILAGNATTDIGTSPLSKAAANRMVHIYVETGSPEALKSFLAWAQESGQVSPLLQGFAAYRQEVWAGPTKRPDIEDMAIPTPRSFEYADRLIKVCDNLAEGAENGFKTSDILKPLLAGCVGESAAVELLAYRKLFDETPSLQEVVRSPQTAKIPAEPSILYSLTIALTDSVVHPEGDGTNPPDAALVAERRLQAEKVAEYGLRWPEEPAAYLFRRLSQKNPAVIATPAYQNWTKKSNRKMTVDFSSKKLTPDMVKEVEF